MVDAQLPDGRILNFPDGTSPEVIQRTVKKVLGVEDAPAPSPGRGFFSDLTNAAVNGITFGLADEVGAAGTAVGRLLKGEDANYQEALANERAQAHRFERENPKSAIAANVAGGLANPLAKVFTGGGTLLQQAGKAAAVGGGMGGLYGAGNAEGGLSDRAEGAAFGAASGAALGAAAVPLLAGLGYGVNKAVGAIKRALDRSGNATAQIKVAEAVRRLGGGDMKKGIAIVRSRIQQGGPDTVLADVLDLGGQRVVRGASNVPGGASQKTEKFITARMAGRGARLHSAADDIAPNDFHGAIDALTKERNAAASPLYEKAFAPVSDKAGGVMAQWDDRLQQFLDDPIIQQGMAKGIRVQQLEALAENRPFNYQEYAVKALTPGQSPVGGKVIQGFEGSPSLVIDKTPNLRTMDAAKRGLDEILEGYRDPTTGKLVLDQYGRAVEKVRAALVDKLDDITTVNGQSLYKQARDAYAGPSKLMDAAWRGRRFLRGDSEVTKKTLEAMTDAEKSAFRLGVRREITRMIDTDTQAALNKFSPKKVDFWNKLEAVFPDKKSLNQFKFKIMQEAKKFRTEQFISTRGGSRTTPLAEDIADLSSVPQDRRPLVEAVAQLLRGNVGTAVGSLGGPVFDRLSRPNQKLALQILNRTLTTGEPLSQAIPARLRDTISQEAITAAQRAITTTGATRQ